MNETQDHHLIHYAVNDEPQSSTSRELTPRQIMEKAGVNPAENYLVRIKGRERISYKDNPDSPIELHEDEKFITIFTGPVPVS